MMGQTETFSSDLHILLLHIKIPGVVLNLTAASPASTLPLAGTMRNLN